MQGIPTVTEVRPDVRDTAVARVQPDADIPTTPVLAQVIADILLGIETVRLTEDTTAPEICPGVPQDLITPGIPVAIPQEDLPQPDHQAEADQAADPIPAVAEAAFVAAVEAEVVAAAEEAVAAVEEAVVAVEELAVAGSKTL